MLLKFSKIGYDVVFSELEAFIITLFGSDRQKELAAFKHLYHDFNILLNFFEHFLGLFGLDHTKQKISKYYGSRYSSISAD